MEVMKALIRGEKGKGFVRVKGRGRGKEGERKGRGERRNWREKGR